MTTRLGRQKPNNATACLYLLIVSVYKYTTYVSGMVGVHGYVQTYHCKYVVPTFQNNNLVHNSFNIQQYICYITLLNMFRAARCSKHVEECNVTYMLLNIKRIVH